MWKGNWQRALNDLTRNMILVESIEWFNKEYDFGREYWMI